MPEGEPVACRAVRGSLEGRLSLCPPRPLRGGGGEQRSPLLHEERAGRCCGAAEQP